VVIEGRTWSELLSPSECWALLGKSEIGRVAVMVDGRPEIFPVTFAVDHDTIVFRTDVGTKVHGLREQPRTSFEVDGTGPQLRSGWSVLVKGQAREVTSAEEAARLAGIELHRWAHGDKTTWIRITPDQVTGRRLARPTGAIEDRGRR
jgi:nitroimidazol reductase NimA-like FMN-containing flavoprotein (pyridoxamine 5'-phosphate oxidase superfamily)